MKWPPPVTAWCRSLAVAIAVFAVLDPTLQIRRRAPLAIAIAVEDSVQSAEALAMIRAQMPNNATWYPAPFPAADVTIFLGERPPIAAGELHDPIIAVSTTRKPLHLAWLRLDLPATVPVSRSVQLSGSLHLAGVPGRQVAVSLHANGAIVATRELTVESSDTIVDIRMLHVPTAVGLSQLRLTATFAGADSSGASAAVDGTVEVTDRKWPVLFFDPRPSWLSTFVRRAVEEDPAFLVSSKVITSRNIATTSGSSPNTLSNLTAMERYDVVVIGAPEELTVSDVTALETLLRRRGAHVVLLMDRIAEGPIAGLLGSPRWQQDSTRTFAIRPQGGDTIALRASRLAWPRQLPPTAEVLAYAMADRGDTTHYPAIWSTAIGSGTLTVSAALDSWTWREPSQSDFNAFWRTRLAAHAMAAPPPILSRIDPAMPRPGETVTLRVQFRDPGVAQDNGAGSLPQTRGAAASLARVGAALVDGAGVPLWPTGVAGELVGRFTAPDSVGIWQIRVTTDGEAVVLPFLVSRDAHRVAAPNAVLLKSWAEAHGGHLLPDSSVGDLQAQLADMVPPRALMYPWRPMRSPWWLLPFALSLSVEWWHRRRRGLP